MPCYGTEYTPVETIVYEDFELEQPATTTTVAPVEPSPTIVQVSPASTVIVDYSWIAELIGLAVDKVHQIFFS